MKSKAIHLMVMALVSVSQLKGDEIGEEWKASKALITAIHNAKDADAQRIAVNSFVEEMWKHRDQKSKLKIILCDRQGEQIDWSKRNFRAETTASIIVIPLRTDDQLKPFVVIPQNPKVVYSFIRDF